jgi:hypothetical protein
VTWSYALREKANCDEIQMTVYLSIGISQELWKISPLLDQPIDFHLKG